MSSIAIFDIGATPTTMHVNVYDLPFGALPVAPTSVFPLTGRATFGIPVSACYDKNGNLYLVCTPSGAILKLTPSGVQSTFVASSAATGGTGQCGITLDQNGNVYVVTILGGIDKYDSTGSGPSTFATTALGTQGGMCFNAQGNMIVIGALAPSFNTVIVSITPAGAQTILNANASDIVATPSGLNFDNAGNMYVIIAITLGVEATILKYSSTGVIINASFSDWNTGGDSYPYGLAFDPIAQNFYTSMGPISATVNNTSWSVNLAGTQATFASNTFLGPYAIAGPLVVPVVPPPTPPVTTLGTGPQINTRILPSSSLGFSMSRNGRDFICPQSTRNR